MKSKVNFETTMVSYLTARRSRDLIVAAHQQITEEWWENRCGHYCLHLSELVIREAGYGDQYCRAENPVLFPCHKRIPAATW